MSITDEDKTFEARLADKRHNQLYDALKKIAQILSNDESNRAIVNAINEQVEKTNDLSKIIGSFPDLEKPIINVDVKQEEVLSYMQEIFNDVITSNNKVIEALENRKLPDTFDLIKTSYGVTKSVKVNYKPAKEILI